jgi:hypothetical protein
MPSLKAYIGKINEKRELKIAILINNFVRKDSLKINALCVN